MARQEQDREDLLREATALVERAELSVPGLDDAVVAGFRRDGAGSLFVGADPVFQFNRAGELRRAYRGGRLLKSEKGRLIELTRERGDRQVTLLRRELNEAEAVALLELFASVRAQLLSALTQRQYRLVGQVPEQTDVVARIADWLAHLAPSPAIADAPNVR